MHHKNLLSIKCMVMTNSGDIKRKLSRILYPHALIVILFSKHLNHDSPTTDVAFVNIYILYIIDVATHFSPW